MLDSILVSGASTLSVTNMIVLTAASVILGLIISLAYMFSTERYTKNFAITIVLLPLLVQVVIMLVNGNLGTGVAILGAFSLVRFRSVPGNSKEIATVFFAMAAGLATGTGYITYAAIFVVLVSLILVLLSKTGFGVRKDYKKHLKVIIPENLDYTNVFDDIFETYLEDYELAKVKTSNLGSMFELSYDVKFREDAKEKMFIDEIRTRNGNLLVLIERKSGSMEEL